MAKEKTTKARPFGTYDGYLALRIVSAQKAQKKLTDALLARHESLDCDDFKKVLESGSMDKIWAKAIELVGSESSEEEAGAEDIE